MVVPNNLCFGHFAEQPLICSCVLLAIRFHLVQQIRISVIDLFWFLFISCLIPISSSINVSIHYELKVCIYSSLLPVQISLFYLTSFKFDFLQKIVHDSTLKAYVWLHNCCVSMWLLTMCLIHTPYMLYFLIIYSSLKICFWKASILVSS